MLTVADKNVCINVVGTNFINYPGFMHTSGVDKDPKIMEALLKEIPVVWEDTRYLDGYPGKEVVIARKSGNRWYIAGINGENLAKEITIDLSPLGEIPASIDLIVDGEGARDLQSTQVQPGEGKLSIQLKPYGGFAGYWE